MALKRSCGRGTTRNGRSKRTEKHVRIYEWEIKSKAYQSLHPYARSLLIEFRRRFNGNNNGRISFSVREARTAIGCGRKAAERALFELQDRGFIKIVRKGLFTVREATEWALTNEKLGDKLATKEYMCWTHKAGSKKQTVVPSENTISDPKVPCKEKTTHLKTPNNVPREHCNLHFSPILSAPEGHTYSLPCEHEEPVGLIASQARATQKPSDWLEQTQVGSDEKRPLRIDKLVKNFSRDWIFLESGDEAKP